MQAVTNAVKSNIEKKKSLKQPMEAKNITSAEINISFNFIKIFRPKYILDMKFQGFIHKSHII